MPTIHREGGFRFIVFLDDHGPAHVHVFYAGAIAKVAIGDVDRRSALLDPGRMRTPDLRRAIRIVETNQERFLEAWREIHGT